MTLIKDILYGMAIGDALGVPYEFKSREEIKKNPCTDMIGFGTHNQPKGTWSDDTSLALATVAGSSNKRFDINKIATNFIFWRDGYKFTPNNEVFDIGNTTNLAITKIKEHKLPVTLCGGYTEESNGNGSLMRILPIVDYIIHLKTLTEINDEHINILVGELSSITHRHYISIESCRSLIYFALVLNDTKNKENPYYAINNAFRRDLNYSFPNTKLRLGLDDFNKLEEKDIKSGGYVLDTLEASIWCLLTTDNYKDAVLKAVNLGSDTDTTACVTGGLAGILYGYDFIPKEWINDLQGKDLINDIIENYEKSKI